MKNKILISIILFLVLTVPYSCTEPLVEEVYSELSDGYLKTEAGMNTLVYSAYASAHTAGLNYPRDIMVSTYMSGIGYGVGGSWETATAVVFANYTWDANNNHLVAKWNELFNIIRNANIVLDKIDLEGTDYSDSYKQLTKAEMKAIRGSAYAIAYNAFGPTPIFTTTITDELEKPRASEAEMMERIESDLTEAVADLPVEPSQYGRMTKGAALGFLCKHYLNTKQWQKSADAAKAIMDLNKYQLIANYTDIFGATHEANNELIWVHTADAVNHIEFFNGVNLPTDYPLDLPTQATWAAKNYWYDSFLDSFEEGDTRLNPFVKSYVSTATGEEVAGYGVNQSLCLKYGLDPNAVSVNSGIDLPEIRLGDILLSRAEALNELSGPTQEGIDLINQVRTRAGIGSLSLGDYTQATLRDKILEERMHELYFEGKEREDLIRHGKLISGAVARGKNAQAYHVLFAIPQAELDANSNINENNTGY